MIIKTGQRGEINKRVKNSRDSMLYQRFLIGLNVTIVELDGAFIHIQQLKKRAAQQNRTNRRLSIGSKGGMYVVINPGQGIM